MRSQDGPGFNVIGNFAQGDHYIETDLDNKKIGWTSRDCTLPLWSQFCGLKHIRIQNNMSVRISPLKEGPDSLHHKDVINKGLHIYIQN
jgi:hypothetical protein